MKVTPAALSDGRDRLRLSAVHGAVDRLKLGSLRPRIGRVDPQPKSRARCPAGRGCRVAARRRRDRGRADRAVARAVGRRLAATPRPRCAPGFRAGDLVVAAPSWADAILRVHLGDLIPAEVAGRLDDERFGRVWEVSQRGARAEEAGRGPRDQRTQGGAAHGAAGRTAGRPSSATTSSRAGRTPASAAARAAAPTSTARTPATASSVPASATTSSARRWSRSISACAARCSRSRCRRPPSSSNTRWSVWAARWWWRPGCTTPGCARRRRGRSTCASSSGPRSDVQLHDAQRRRLGGAAHRHLGARRQAGGRALRDHVAGAVRPPLRVRRRGARVKRRADRLITLALAIAAVAWLLATEGRQGFGRDEGQYMRAGERYWGWFEQLGTNLASGKLKESFTPRDDRSLLERQRPRPPRRHEDALRPVVAGVSSLHTAPGRRAACIRSRSRAGTSRCRCSRAIRPRSAFRRSCSPRCWWRWSTGSRADGCRRRPRPPRRC